MENEKRARNEILLLVHFLAGSAVLEEKKTKKTRKTGVGRGRGTGANSPETGINLTM